MDFGAFGPVLLVSFIGAVIAHSFSRKYVLSCIAVSVISGFFVVVCELIKHLPAFVDERVQVGFLVWSPLYFFVGIMCGICASSLVGVVFLGSRKFKDDRMRKL